MVCVAAGLILVDPQSQESGIQCPTKHCHVGARSFLINKAFSAISKLLTPKVWNIYCWSHKTLVTCIISQWILCFLWDAFNSNVAIFNAYKWCHSDVIV